MQTKYITTAELARQRGVQSQAIRKRLCVHGSYYGIKPQRFASGHLMWPADTLERLLSAAAAPRRRHDANGKFLPDATATEGAPIVVPRAKTKLPATRPNVTRSRAKAADEAR